MPHSGNHDTASRWLWRAECWHTNWKADWFDTLRLVSAALHVWRPVGNYDYLFIGVKPSKIHQAEFTIPHQCALNMTRVPCFGISVGAAICRYSLNDYKMASLASEALEEDTGSSQVRPLLCSALLCLLGDLFRGIVGFPCADQLINTLHSTPCGQPGEAEILQTQTINTILFIFRCSKHAIKHLGCFQMCEFAILCPAGGF